MDSRDKAASSKSEVNCRADLGHPSTHCEQKVQVSVPIKAWNFFSVSEILTILIAFDGQSRMQAVHPTHSLASWIILPRISGNCLSAPAGYDTVAGFEKSCLSVRGIIFPGSYIRGSPLQPG